MSRSKRGAPRAPLFHAHLSTEHFTFDAFAETREQARHLVTVAFNRNRESASMPKMTPTALDEEYGIGIYEAVAGRAYQDGLEVIG